MKDADVTAIAARCHSTRNPKHDFASTTRRYLAPDDRPGEVAGQTCGSSEETGHCGGDGKSAEAAVEECGASAARNEGGDGEDESLGAANKESMRCGSPET